MVLKARRDERSANRQFIVRDQEDRFVCLLSFRHLCALSAAEQGLVVTVQRRRSYYGMTDYWLELDCELFGIGAGTLWSLQSDGLLRKRNKAGQRAQVTLLGRRVLAAIRETGVETLMTERVPVAA
jgi:hypothetical protein